MDAPATPSYRQRVVTFGGGTGHYNLLRGLVTYNEPECITAIPGTWDDGGSSGRLRTELGVLPPGDARQCLLALMLHDDQREVCQRLFDDRLADVEGPFRGHSVGNLITARLEQIFRGQDRGLDAARSLFRIASNVVPVSLIDLRLIAKTVHGNEIEGETNVDLRGRTVDFEPDDRIHTIYFSTKASPNPKALEAIAQADKIIFSSGDLFTSVVPHLLVDGIREAILASKATVILVLNLMTKMGETDRFKASDFLSVFLDYLGTNDRLQYLVASTNQLDEEVLRIYQMENQEPVDIDDADCLRLAPNLKIVRAELARYLRREHLLRHDPAKLALTVLGIQE